MVGRVTAGHFIAWLAWKMKADSSSDDLEHDDQGNNRFDDEGGGCVFGHPCPGARAVDVSSVHSVDAHSRACSTGGHICEVTMGLCVLSMLSNRSWLDPHSSRPSEHNYPPFAASIGAHYMHPDLCVYAVLLLPVVIRDCTPGRWWFIENNNSGHITGYTFIKYRLHSVASRLANTRSICTVSLFRSNRQLWYFR